MQHGVHVAASGACDGASCKPSCKLPSAWDYTSPRLCDSAEPNPTMAATICNAAAAALHDRQCIKTASTQRTTNVHTEESRGRHAGPHARRMHSFRRSCCCCYTRGRLPCGTHIHPQQSTLWLLHCACSNTTHTPALSHTHVRLPRYSVARPNDTVQPPANARPALTQAHGRPRRLASRHHITLRSLSSAGSA